MCSEGTMWFPDLTMPDTYFVLPVLSGMSLLVTVELGAADGMQGQSESMMKNMKMFMRFVSIIVVPLTASFPTSMFCYWITSNLFSLGQTLMLKNERVKSMLGVPVIKPEKTKEQLIKELVGKPVKTFANKPKMAATIRTN